jgi:mannose-6-phosphate isomerase-like protein (cupin superfamily)
VSGTAAAFPGATALTGLRVYDWPTADGLAGGSAHIHLLSTDAYVVRSGAGRVETLSSNGFAVHDLAPGDVVWFTPGTVHRLVNLDHLELLVVMANAGLPEAGDAVMTFPPEVLADPDAYARAASLARDDRIYAADADAARARRDLAITGYLQLRKAVQDDGPIALAAGPVAVTAAVSDRWTALAGRGPAALADATVSRIDAPVGEKLGMCGWLTTYEQGSARVV